MPQDEFDQFLEEIFRDDQQALEDIQSAPPVWQSPVTSSEIATPEPVATTSEAVQPQTQQVPQFNHSDMLPPITTPQEFRPKQTTFLDNPVFSTSSNWTPAQPQTKSYDTPLETPSVEEVERNQNTVHFQMVPPVTLSELTHTGNKETAFPQGQVPQVSPVQFSNQPISRSPDAGNFPQMPVSQVQPFRSEEKPIQGASIVEFPAEGTKRPQEVSDNAEPWSVIQQASKAVAHEVGQMAAEAVQHMSMESHSAITDAMQKLERRHYL